MVPLRYYFIKNLLHGDIQFEVMSTYGPSQSAMLWSTNIQERAFAMGIATVTSCFRMLNQESFSPNHEIPTFQK